jgi:glutamate synthase (NADPH/NADH) small chain
VYRGTEKEMSAYDHEISGGRIDGVGVICSRIPTKVVRNENGRVVALRVARTENKRAVAGTDEDLPADIVVVATGQSRLTDLARAFAGVELDARGRVIVDAATYRTGNPQVWSGGDCVNGGKEVVNAVAEARVAARSMHAFLVGGG